MYENKQTIIISSAGMGTRLKRGLSKALLDIDGKPLIVRQLELLGASRALSAQEGRKALPASKALGARQERRELRPTRARRREDTKGRRPSSAPIWRRRGAKPTGPWEPKGAIWRSSTSKATLWTADIALRIGAVGS